MGFGAGWKPTLLWGLEVGVVVVAGGGSRGVEDAVCQLRVCIDGGVWPEEGVEELGVGADLTAGADDGVDDEGGGVDGGGGVDSGALGAGGIGLVSIEVGFAGSEVEPIAIVEDAGAEGALGGELEEGGDD